MSTWRVCAGWQLESQLRREAAGTSLIASSVRRRPHGRTSGAFCLQPRLASKTHFASVCLAEF